MLVLNIMTDREFIYETSNHQKIKTLFVVIVSLMFSIGIYMTIRTIFDDAFSSASFQTLKNTLFLQIKDFTPVGLFFLGFGGALFFLPYSEEIFFILGLSNGNNPWISLFFIFAGVFPAHALNYWIGTRFSFATMQFMSTKKIYKTKRMVNRWGAYAIFFCNLTPLPAPLLSFALGIAKYNTTRFWVFLVLGIVVKYLAIIGLFTLYGSSLQTFLMSISLP